jgi:YHS domain-containing protein
MKYLLVFALFLGLASFAVESNAQETPKTKTAATEEGAIFNTVCPVSGEEIDEEITHAHEGKTYAVCCNSCLKKFKADPEKYISRLSEDGKSIKKKNKQE